MSEHVSATIDDDLATRLDTHIENDLHLETRPEALRFALTYYLNTTENSDKNGLELVRESETWSDN